MFISNSRVAAPVLGMLLGLAVAAGRAEAAPATLPPVDGWPGVPLNDAVLGSETPIDPDAAAGVDRVSLIQSTSREVVSERAAVGDTPGRPGLAPSAVVVGIADESSAKRQDRLLLLRQSGQSTQTIEESDQGRASRISQSAALNLSPSAVDPQLGMIAQSGAYDLSGAGRLTGTSQSAANVNFTASGANFRP